MVTRPLAMIGSTYMLAAWVAIMLPTRTCMGIGILLGGLGLLTLLSKRSERIPIALIVLSAGAAFVAVMLTNVLSWEPMRMRAGERVDLEGVVTEVRSSNSLVMETTEGMIVELGSREVFSVRRGDWIQTTDVLLEYYEGNNGAQHLRQRAKLIPLRGFAAHEIMIQSPQEGPSMWIQTLREQLSLGLRRRLSGYHGDVLAGMLLGERFRIDPVLRGDFQIAGIAHLLAISGCHIGILVTFLRGLLRRMCLGVQLASGLAGVVVIGYMLLVGTTPSVFRAGLMSLVYLAAEILGRSRDRVTSLMFSGLVLCLLNPFAVADLGVQMSFASTLGILLVSPHITRWLTERISKARWLRVKQDTMSVIGVSIGSALFLTPVTLLSDTTFSLYSLVTNVLIAPMIPIAIMGGLIGMLVSLLPQGHLLAAPFLLAAGSAVSAISSLAAVIARLPLASLPTSAKFLLIWMVGAALLVAVALVRPTKRKRRTCAAVCLLTLAVGIATYQWTLLEVVQTVVFRTDGASAMVAIKDGHAAVVGDIRSKQDANRLREVLGRYLIREIDLLVLWPSGRARNPEVGQVLRPYNIHTAILPQEDRVDARLLEQVQPMKLLAQERTWRIELFGKDSLVLEPGAVLANFSGVKTFLLTGDCDILSCMMREGAPTVAVLTGGIPDNLDRLRCAGLISNGVVSGVGPDFSARTIVFNEIQSEAGFAAKDGRVRFFF